MLWGGNNLQAPQLGRQHVQAPQFKRYCGAATFAGPPTLATKVSVRVALSLIFVIFVVCTVVVPGVVVPGADFRARLSLLGLLGYSVDLFASSVDLLG
ncbi:hypothetical protein Drorol1_Dr00023476 [Drosera rotundifolia]